VAVDFAPFRVSLYVDGQEQVVANSRGLMHFEQRGGSADRQRQGADGAGADFDRHGGKEVVDYGEDGLAIYADGTKEERRVLDDRSTQGHDGDGPETFQGHTDHKRNGPTSVGLDLAFPGFTQLYGLPEHAGPLALRTTRGAGAQYSDPYRLYNLDVFEYELDNPMALYGAVPLLMGHKVGGVGGHSTAGAFWFNPSETFVDIERTPEAMRARLISESGVVDLLLLPGPSPAAAYRQYAQATGFPQLPPLFALAYHQCRWNYKDEKDVLQVDAKFEELDFPYDVIWLDIEHTDDKRYFTWNSHLFPDPARMINAVAAHGRRMVTIVDPHVKRDANYRIHKIATDKGYYVKDRDGEDFDGWCWPGASSYLDFTSEEVRSWWADQFALDTYQGSTLDLFTWNDMNEPSVFNGPEVSMSKECQSLAGVEHREWHNLYGLYFHRATAEGLRRRSPGGNLRPFVLSRSFFAGTQTAGAIWTGDNAAEWSHLAVAAPMLLQLSVGGVPFVGADVGGFFGNPEPELLIRWYQAGAFQPFFRAHAHIETKRREPWVFGEPTTSILRHAVMRRYQFLPLWYTLFFEGTFSGLPPMRPLWMEFPEDTEVLAMDDQWMVGAALLVKPVVEAGKTSVDVYLPKGVWYNELDAQKHTSSGAVKRFAAPLESLPVFLRGGAIVPKKMRLRRSSRLMAPDPYTLVVAPDEKGRADGTLFMDDEESFDYTNGAMRYMTMKFDGISLTSTVSDIKSSDTRFKPQNRIERVVILGQTAAPSRVTLLDQQEKETELTFDYDINKQALTVRKPGCLAATSWAIVISNDKSQLSS